MKYTGCVIEWLQNQINKMCNNQENKLKQEQPIKSAIRSYK